MNQDEAIKLGREFWEEQYRKGIANRDKAIRLIMRDMKGMEPDNILEEFATLQVNDALRAYRQWIDETFTNTKML